ncbi:hypothetical protein Scep_005145 [Stephania cephalantha]|uniref:Uncharacterized protein n=1 Tax=Stephania cephalantha TaxID=152367 RepID=A0AAP0KTS2_9MAGN
MLRISITQLSQRVSESVEEGVTNMGVDFMVPILSGECGHTGTKSKKTKLHEKFRVHKFQQRVC